MNPTVGELGFTIDYWALPTQQKNPKKEKEGKVKTIKIELNQS